MNAIAVTAKSLRQRYLFVPQHMKLVHLVWLLLNFGPVRVPVIDEGGSSDTSRKEAQEMKWAGAKNAIVFVRHKHEVRSIHPLHSSLLLSSTTAAAATAASPLNHESRHRSFVVVFGWCCRCCRAYERLTKCWSWRANSRFRLCACTQDFLRGGGRQPSPNLKVLKCGFCLQPTSLLVGLTFPRFSSSSTLTFPRNRGLLWQLLVVVL